MANQFS